MLYRLSYFNLPLSVIKGHRHNPLSAVAELVRPDDFAVVKVDFDSPTLEAALVEQMLAPEISALVDELYFEYHFHFGADARGPWGETQNKNKSSTDPPYLPDDVDDALGLMRRLREAGIRSHFWI